MDYSFGNWVKRRRKALDLTQQDLAKRVGCSVSLIFKIESDERRPSRQVAGLLVQHLDIPPDQQDLFLKIARQEKGIQNLDFVPTLSTPQPALVKETIQNNLPDLPTPLIGREHEVSMLLRQLQDPSCRLLTLTGPGGVGKTRLALEVARKVDSVFEHGVYFVSLVGTTSSEFILPAIADSLGFTFSSSTDPKAQLYRFLKNKHTLLVLDNLEHLLSDIELISDIIESGPAIKVLATSREQLNLRSEWAFAVQGLPVPANISLENSLSNSAIALFLQRSRQAKMDFTLTDEDLPFVQRICQLVEGLPLGLEIAASWVRVLSCREIAREIEKNIDFLTATARDLPQRHRSIRAVFDYSWSLLLAEEQQVLMKLSVFRGGFTRDSAEKVAGATLQFLSALVDKSLVWHSNGERYELHELIRQYAHEQLDKAGKLEQTCNSHFAFYLALVEASRSELHGINQIEWLNRLEEDHDNLRAALEWSLRYEGLKETLSEEQEKTIQESFQLAGALYLFWWMRSHWSEGRLWLQRVLDQPTNQPVTFERFRALNAAVVLAVEQADHRRALQISDEGLGLAEELGDANILAFAHLARATIFWKKKDYVTAFDHGEKALELFRKLEKRFSVGSTLQTLARIAINQHSLGLAQTYLEECLDIFQEVGNTLQYNTVLSDLGLLAYLRNDSLTARKYQEISLVYFREAGNIAGIEMTLNRLGDIARCENNYAVAERLYTEAMAMYRETGDKDEIASLLHNLGYIAQHRGEYSQAISHFREGLALQHDLDNQAGIAECLAGIAGILAEQGQADRAGRLFGASEALREAVGAVLWPANQMEYDRNLAFLRNSITQDRLSAIWAQGRLLSSAQAIKEASKPPLMNADVIPYV